MCVWVCVCLCALASVSFTSTDFFFLLSFFPVSHSNPPPPHFFFIFSFVILPSFLCATGLCRLRSFFAISHSMWPRANTSTARELNVFYISRLLCAQSKCTHISPSTQLHLIRILCMDGCILQYSWTVWSHRCRCYAICRTMKFDLGFSALFSLRHRRPRCRTLYYKR